MSREGSCVTACQGQCRLCHCRYVSSLFQGLRGPIFTSFPPRSPCRTFPTVWLATTPPLHMNDRLLLYYAISRQTVPRPEKSRSGKASSPEGEIIDNLPIGTINFRIPGERQTSDHEKHCRKTANLLRDQQALREISFGENGNPLMQESRVGRMEKIWSVHLAWKRKISNEETVTAAMTTRTRTRADWGSRGPSLELSLPRVTRKAAPIKPLDIYHFSRVSLLYTTSSIIYLHPRAYVWRRIPPVKYTLIFSKPLKFMQ